MGATAACVGEIATIPLDTAKVRLQIQQVKPGETPKYTSFMQTMKTISAEEGPVALFRGLTPGLQRQVVFAGLRLGMYVPIRNLISGELPEGQNPTLVQKILAGLLSGGLAICVANPTDVVKIRLQAQGSLPKEQWRYNGSVDCYSKIFKADGIKGFWVGIGPNVMRNSIVNAAEIASYDQYKQILGSYLPDGVGLHITCAFLAGFNACVVGSPVDVMKTRLMNKQPGQPATVASLFSYIVTQEGVGAFYKGFTANFLRLGCWNTVMFVTLEQLKKTFDA